MQPLSHGNFSLTLKYQDALGTRQKYRFPTGEVKMCLHTMLSTSTATGCPWASRAFCNPSPQPMWSQLDTTPSAECRKPPMWGPLPVGGPGNRLAGVWSQFRPAALFWLGGGSRAFYYKLQHLNAQDQNLIIYSIIQHPNERSDADRVTVIHDLGGLPHLSAESVLPLGLIAGEFAFPHPGSAFAGWRRLASIPPNSPFRTSRLPGPRSPWTQTGEPCQAVPRALSQILRVPSVGVCESHAGM